MQYVEKMQRRADAATPISDKDTLPAKLSEIHPLTLYGEMDEILNDCETIQKTVLSEILERAQGTAYASQYGLNGVTDLEQWKKSAQVSTYDNYRQLVEDAMDGAEHQLFQGETALYIATTGSTGKLKYFAESEAGNTAKQLIMTVRGMYMSSLLPITLDMEAKNLTISNYAPVGNDQSGKMIVRASGQTARNMRKKTGTMNLLPVEFWEADGISAFDRDYMMAVYTLAEVRFSKVFCNNVIHFGRILDRIVAEGARMIEDIRRGEFSVEMPDSVRESLKETFPANPARAERLQAIYDKKQCLISSPEDIAEIWPAFEMISCWLSGSVGRDAREVIRRLPKYIKCFEMGYGASEAKINIPTKLASASGVAAPFALFYEFAPLDGGEVKCLWEVEDKQYYELWITTYSGLYRYNMLDVVQIDGFIGNTPNLVFCGKSSEKLYLYNSQGEEQVIHSFRFANLIREVELEQKVQFDLVQMVQQDAGYAYVLESKNEIDWKKIKTILDEKSKALWDISSDCIYVMKHEYKDARFTAATRIDRGACGIKQPVLLPELQEEYVEQTIR